MEEAGKTEAEKTLFSLTGNRYIDNGLHRISKRMINREAFGGKDLNLIERILQNKLDCHICRGAMITLYLHVKNRENKKTKSADWKIMEAIVRRAKEISLLTGMPRAESQKTKIPKIHSDSSRILSLNR